jgi:rhodanese-related sulfurtransferase
MAASLAASMGYRKVYWYKGGIKAWKDNGNSISYTVKTSRQVPPPVDSTAILRRVQKGEQIFFVDVRDQASREKFGVINAPHSLHYPLYRLHSLYWELPRNKKLVL